MANCVYVMARMLHFYISLHVNATIIYGHAAVFFSRFLPSTYSCMSAMLPRQRPHLGDTCQSGKMATLLS